MITDDLIASHSNLIHKIAGGFYGVEKEDLYQAGILGLIKAYQNFDANAGAKFSSYAYNYIYGEMYMLAQNKNLKYSKNLLRLYHVIEKTRFSLAQKYERVPSNEEIASFLELSPSEIDEACAAGMQIMSLDSGEQMSIYDTVAKKEDISHLDKIVLNDSLQNLSESERKIIEARFFEDLTQSEVARKLSMTQVMVSRYEKKGLNKMYEYLTM